MKYIFLCAPHANNTIITTYAFKSYIRNVTRYRPECMYWLSLPKLKHFYFMDNRINKKY